MDGNLSRVTEWRNLSLAVVDVEGNGQSPPDVIELAIVPVVRGVIETPRIWRIKPPNPVKHFATRIHGIRNADLENEPAFAEIASAVAEVLMKADALVAHAAHVDVKVLRRAMPGWEPPTVFDTLILAKQLVPGLVSYKLGSLVEHFTLAEGLSPDLKPHQATYDALVTARLFVRLAALAAEGETDGEAGKNEGTLF